MNLPSSRTDIAKSAFETEMLTLASWPQLRRLPAERLGIYARICVLLAYTPSVGYLIHRRLGLRSDDVQHVLRALHDEGHLRVSSGPHQRNDEVLLAEKAATDQPQVPPRVTLWGKLLTKLLS